MSLLRVNDVNDVLHVVHAQLDQATNELWDTHQLRELMRPQLMLLLGTAVVGWIITYGYRAHRRRKERLREWMLDAEDDEFDPEVMKLGEANHKVDIALGLAVLISFLFGLYIMLTELLRWGWELI